jgi:hypothetical protein
MSDGQTTSYVGRSVAAELAGLEAKYHGRARQSLVSAGAVRVTPGQTAAVLTAPHSVPTLRGGEPKRREIYTGAWAELIAARTGAWSVTMMHPEPRESPEETTGRAVETLVGDGGLGLLVDIHGMADRHGLDVCLGSGPEGQSGEPARQLSDLLQGQLRVSVDRPFRGAGTTICRWVTERYPTCEVCQVELGPRLRSASASEALLDAVADAMSVVVTTFAECHRGGAKRRSRS